MIMLSDLFNVIISRHNIVKIADLQSEACPSDIRPMKSPFLQEYSWQLQLERVFDAKRHPVVPK